jgi:uncharacterized FlaG/YvyC family protein
MEGDGYSVLTKRPSLKIVTGSDSSSSVIANAELYEAVRELNDKLGPVLETVEFFVEDKPEVIVVAIDNVTQKIIRLIPSEEVFLLLRALACLKEE